MTDAAALILRALDPSRSVVVEACAGSGKTWLLASRIVRLLLAGVAPGEILAITFTRKAAREIEERVVNWLHQLATCSAAQVIEFLAERGVPVGATDEAEASTIRTARGLYERVLTAPSGLAVNTFHSWFLQLVDAAPLSANLAGAMLVETDSRLFDELWQSFAGSLQKMPAHEVTQAFVRLLDEAGLDATKRLIVRAMDRRSEWLAYADAESGTAEKIVAGLRAQSGAGETGQALGEFFAGEWQQEFQAYLGFLEMSKLKSDQDAAAKLRMALDDADRARSFEGLRSVFLIKEGTLRAKQAGGTLDQRYTPQGAARFIELHRRLGERVIVCLEQQTAERILAFNRDACTVFAAFLAHVEEFKKARRQIDFIDAEWSVLKLLRDEETAAFLQARLDARYSHVLLDEFQDTNPLQWQILMAWLAAYSDSQRPVIFLVGDPKQSIYRFRRAEPKLFSGAADFLAQSFGALRCEQDASRRNAQPIIDVVNAIFMNEPNFAPYREQTSLAGELPGRVELMPLFGKAEDANPVGREGVTALRNPLVEPDSIPEDRRLRQEAECLAEKLGSIVDTWLIEEKGADGCLQQRPARYDDIMLLVRTRTHLACYERALSAANIPYAAGSRGGLLTALEVRDCVALLEFLVTPVDDLKLAHTLRSPIFSCGDDDLMHLAARQESTWWQRLQALVAQGCASPHLVRAARLLEGWLLAADRLPAHDLLDCLFHQGEVLARYRRAVPEAASASVLANLRALLLLALELDGARYPSLPRFIDELRELREADANDAPDQGVIEAPAGVEAGRVRILTLHGAKGLEAPIVWLLGANSAPRSQDAWDVLVDWPAQASGPRHVSFYGRKADRGQARQPLFEAESAAAMREELNLLYVAMTRARQVFFASGIENGKAGGRTPYRLIEAALQRLVDSGEGSAHGLAYGDSLPVSCAAPGEKRRPGATAVYAPLPQIGERRRVADDATRFGILFHALLERRTAGEERTGWWKELGFDEGDYRRVLPAAERLLAADALQRFFNPALYRRAWNEVEISTGKGELLRIDRLVEFDAEVWVLDYKSSGTDSARLEEYRTQIAGYCRALEAVSSGKAVRGALIFADASLLETY